MKEAAFLSEFRVLDVTEGRETSTLELLDPFQVYSAVLDAIITVPAGFRFDGESIPAALQWLVPPFGQSKRGACVHDYLYRTRGFHTVTGEVVPVSRKQADAVYRELITAKGLPKWRATMRWGVLRLVGWAAWNARKVPLVALLLLLLLLSSCTRDIAGLSRNERLTLYGTALTLAGKPEFGVIAYGLRRTVTAPKQPANVQP